MTDTDMPTIILNNDREDRDVDSIPEVVQCLQHNNKDSEIEEDVIQSLMLGPSIPVKSSSKNELSWKECVPQILACLAAPSIVIQAGVNMAYSAILLPELMASHSDVHISLEQGSWLASLVTISTPFGSLLSGTLMDKMGRKSVCKLTCIPMILSWIIVTFVHNIHALYFARILAGFGSGLSSAALIYISEVSHPKLRPMLLCLNSVFVSLGILLTCTLGLWLNYKGMAMSFAVLSLASYMIIWPLPESPYWLATFRKNMDKADEALRWLNRSEESYHNERKRLVESSKQTASTENFYSLKHLLKSCTKRSTVKPILILAFLFIFQQISGAYVIIFYAVNLFRMIGGKFGSGINEYGALVLLGLIRFIMSIVAAFASRKFGRKPLCIFSGIGMAVSTLVAGIYIYNNGSLRSSSFASNDSIGIVKNPVQELFNRSENVLFETTMLPNISLNINSVTLASHTSVTLNSRNNSADLLDLKELRSDFSEENNESFALLIDLINSTDSSIPNGNSPFDEHWIPLACILAYVSFSAIGFLVIPWTLASELLPIDIRATCGGLMIAFAYIVMFVVVKTFPYFLEIVKADGMFFISSCTSFSGALFVYFFLPETFGKSFLEIEEYFK